MTTLPFYIFTNSAQGLPFLHILTQPCSSHPNGCKDKIFLHERVKICPLLPPAPIFAPLPSGLIFSLILLVFISVASPLATPLAWNMPPGLKRQLRHPALLTPPLPARSCAHPDFSPLFTLLYSESAVPVLLLRDSVTILPLSLEGWGAV